MPFSTPADDLFVAHAATEVGSTCVAFTSLARPACEWFRLGGADVASGEKRSRKLDDGHGTPEAGISAEKMPVRRPLSPRSHLDRSVASEQEVKGEKEDKLAPGELVVFSAASAAEDKSARVREFYVGSGAALRLQELDTASAGLGHAVWASGLALAAFVSAHQNDFAGKRVLELGGGVCLPGLAAACAPRPPAEVSQQP